MAGQNQSSVNLSDARLAKYEVMARQQDVRKVDPVTVGFSDSVRSSGYGLAVSKSSLNVKTMDGITLDLQNVHTHQNTLERFSNDCRK